MQTVFDKVTFLCGTKNIPAMQNIPVLPTFSEDVLKLWTNVSDSLLHNPAAKGYPDVITFAFFCRRANLMRLRDAYADIEDSNIGLGVTFHIAPSNVPINFAYSLLAGVLSGNACIVRVSSKPFEQVAIVCSSIEKALQTAVPSMLPYISVVQYSHDQEVTDSFSALCDARLIWGGNSTIEAIRKSPLPMRAFDINFADRFSLCVINAEEILQESQVKQLASDFYNDTYLYDQNACSSPRLMVWIGDSMSVKTAQDIFWSALHEKLLSDYTLAPVVSVNKVEMACRCAIDLVECTEISHQDMLIVRVNVAELTPNIPEYKCPGGFFLEYTTDSLDDMKHIVTNQYQTLSYYGFSAEYLQQWVRSNGLRGFDRIVPIGKTPDFSMIWDGYDLIRKLSRIVHIK